MNERYVRVFNGSGNLYSENAPIIILANVLLKDTETGRAIAQLKLQNVSGETISYVKVRIIPLDSIKNPIGDEILFEYLDLDVYDKCEFGSKKPIVLPNKSTRAFEVSVVCVGFKNGSIWSSDGGEWVSQTDDSDIVKAIATDKIYKEALSLYESDNITSVEKAKTFFEKVECEIDTSIEVVMCDERIASLRSEIENKARKKKDTRLKILVISILLVVFFSAIFSYTYIYPTVIENRAEALIEQKKYDEASALYLKHGFFTDSRECYVRKINDLILAGDACGLYDFGLMFVKNMDTQYENVIWYILDEKAPLLKDADVQEKVYFAVANMLNSDEYAGYILSDDAYGNWDSRCLIGYVEYILTALPDKYNDVSEISNFCSYLMPPHNGLNECILENQYLISKIWKYKTMRNLLLSDRFIDLILNDEWTSQSGDSVISFTSEKKTYEGSGGYYYSTNSWCKNLSVPDVPHKYYNIIDKTYIFLDENSNKVCNVFKFRFCDDFNKIDVYCYEDQKTVTLYRKQSKYIIY